MRCDEVAEVMYLVQDDELEATVVGHFHRHLDDCPPCADRHRRVQVFLGVLRGRLCRAAAPEELRRRILRQFPHRGEMELA